MPAISETRGPILKVMFIIGPFKEVSAAASAANSVPRRKMRSSLQGNHSQSHEAHRTKKTAGERQFPAVVLDSLLPKVSSELRWCRPYCLPYCTFALLTHASFVGPASASHFSIATL
jgi:hypothetical protein